MPTNEELEAIKYAYELLSILSLPMAVTLRDRKSAKCRKVLESYFDKIEAQKELNSKRSVAWKKNNPAKARRIQKRYYKSHKEELAIKQKQYHLNKKAKQNVVCVN